MKLSRNFVEDYVDIDVDTKTLAEAMTKAGNEYDSAGKLIDATNLVIGEIIECVDHPDSDHLHVCKVNVGSEVLQIVCGAPNARAGLKVIVALVGAVLPGDFKIKKGNIRGVESNGMICSIEELGLDSKFLTEADKEGICELGSDAVVGEDPIKYLQYDDEVIDFELTANRGDLLSVIGMAYEIAAIYDKQVKPIDLSYSENNEKIEDGFSIEINTENCSMFLAKKVKNVTIKESPLFIKNRLIASGIRPINNIVDISNYVMLETGQPLHFYDADSLGEKLVVRMAETGEKLTTLDNVERILDENDIVIADSKTAVGLAGVMGGLSTEVEETTKNIIIEAAIFDSVKVRKTSNKILRSEASNRFEKGLDSNRTYMAVDRACNLLEKYADATIVSGMLTYDQTQKEDKEISIEVSNINRVLGIEISKEDVLEVFRKLGFKATANGEQITVLVPRRRIDVNIKEDLIEEVGRIYGVDNIVGKLPELPLKQGQYDKTIREIRNKMIALGLNEALSYILVNEKEAVQFTNANVENVKLLDPITEERSVLRNSMIPSLMKIYEYNKAHDIKDVSIFEVGKGFYKIGQEYKEENKIATLMSGKYYLGIENNKEVDFYIIKGVAEELLDFLGYAGRYSFVEPKEQIKEMHPWQTAEISVNGKIVGIVGKVHPKISKEAVFVLEINLDKLFEIRVGKMKFKEISKFPSVKKDLAFVVNKQYSSQAIEKVIKKAGGSLLTNIEIFDVYEGENIDENSRSIAYSLTFNTLDKTLTDEDINPLIEKIIGALLKEYNVDLRK